MSEIEIKCSKKYIKYLAAHLQEEHPKTKGHIEVELKGKKRRR